MGCTKLLWIDCETTGLSEKRNGIISIAAIADIDGEVVGQFELEMRPTGRFADDEALKINGYTKSQIAKFQPWEEVYPEFIYRVNNIFRNYSNGQKFQLAGQNVGFDNRFVRSWAGKHVEYWDLLVDQVKIIDTKTLGKEKFPELENHKLGYMCEQFGVRLDNAHNAMADTVACRELYYKMIEKIEGAKQLCLE